MTYLSTYRKITRILFICFVSLFSFLSLTYASSHVYVKINETLTLNIDNNDANSEVTWVISQEGSIIDTLKKSTFKYAFKEGGNYLVRLNVMSKRGDLKSSLIEITVSEKIPSFSKLSAKLTTIPEIKDGVITLSGEKAEVLFAFSDSTGNIKNYELESDIFVDSDNDGESDNDIDNKNDASYISGTYFKRLYINTGIPSRAILTVRDENGNEQKASVTIVFDENSENLVVKPLNLKVTTLPKQKENGIIELSQRENSIFIFAGQSSGKIKQYKIDENLEVDSDGDGDSKNDFDNKGTDSADTGVSYPIKIDKDKKTQSFSVTVVGEYDEKRKEYTVKNISSYSNSNNKGVSLEPLLFSSRTKISEGETVTFNIFNYPKNSTVSWDFNGDGIFEIKDSDVKKVEYLYAKEGIYNVSFFLKEVGESPVIQRKTIQVLNKSEGQLKTEPPFAYFYPQTNGNKASFLSSQSRADENLANTDLSYSWNFGDDFKAQGPNVEHVYEFEGNYTVTLTVTDSIGRTGVYSDLVIIEELTNNFEESQHGGSVIRENNKKIEEQKNSGHTENDVVNSDDLKNIDDNPEKNPESGQTDGWKKIEPVIKNSPTIPINSNSNSNSKSSFSWWVIILVILLLLPFLFLLKKKMDNPEKSFKDIVKELNPKKSIEDLKHAENIEAPLEVEKEELLEQKEIKEEEKIKDEESDLDIISEENLPDWMQNAGKEEKTEDSINTENIVEEVEEAEEAEEVEEVGNIEEDVESENLPEWMQNAGKEEKTEDSIHTENIVEEVEKVEEVEEVGNIEEDVESENLPEWMQETTETVEESTEESIEEPIEDINVLSDPFDIPNADTVTPIETPQPLEIIEKPVIKAIDAKIKKENSVKVPEWLKLSE